jgi:hypothetical protein
MNKMTRTIFIFTIALLIIGVITLKVKNLKLESMLSQSTNMEKH